MMEKGIVPARIAWVDLDYRRNIVHWQNEKYCEYSTDSNLGNIFLMPRGNSSAQHLGMM